MAPPKFGDLNKTVKDLFNDDFNFGVAKFTFKSKAPSGVNLKVEQSRRFDDSATAGLLEVKYTNAAHGLTVKDTWDTKSVVSSEVSVANKHIQGHKLTFNNVFSTAGVVSGLKLKHEFASDNVATEAVLTGADVSGAVVAGTGAVSVGVSGAYDTKKSAFSKYSVAGTYSDKGLIVHGAFNGSEVAASVFHKHCPSSQSAVDVKLNTKTGDTNVAAVTKYDLDKSAFVKASVDKKLVVGFGYTQKLRNEVSLTLSAQIDAANLSSDRHRLGAALTVDL